MVGGAIQLGRYRRGEEAGGKVMDSVLGEAII